MKADLLSLMRRDHHLVHKWWNLYKLHKTEHPAKGERKNKKRTQVWATSPRTHKGVTKWQRNKLCSKSPHQLQEAYQRRKRKSKSVLSLEEASLATTTCVKIEATCTLYNIIYIFAYRRHVESSKDCYQCQSC